MLGNKLDDLGSIRREGEAERASLTRALCKTEGVVAGFMTAGLRRGVYHAGLVWPTALGWAAALGESVIVPQSLS